MEKKEKWYDSIESTAGVVILIFMLIVLTYQVMARYIFGISYAWIDELSRYSFVWLAYISAIYAIIHNAHIKIDIFLKVWPKKARNYVKHFSNLIFIAYCLVVAYFSTEWLLGLKKAGTISMGTGISMAFVSIIIPASHVLMAVRLVQLEVKWFRDPGLLKDYDEAEAALEDAAGMGGVKKQ